MPRVALLLLLCCLLGCNASLEDRLDEFLEWFERKGGKFHDHVVPEVLNLPAGARVRIFSTGPLEVNQAVVSVPTDLLINPFGPTGSNDGFCDTEMLAIKLAIEAVNGTASKWGPYLALLPPAPLDSALYLTEEDAAALANTYALHVAGDVRSTFDNFENRVTHSRYSWLSSLRHGGAWGKGSVLRWAAATVHARSFVISKPKDRGHAYHERPFLAPGADLLNHDPVSKVAWKLGAEASGNVESFKILCRQAYPIAGAEVFNHYQDFSNPYLFAYYGFALDNNPHDSLPIQLTLPKGSSRDTHKFLAALNLTQSYRLTPHAIPLPLLNLVRILALPASTLTVPGLRALVDLNYNLGTRPVVWGVSLDSEGNPNPEPVPVPPPEAYPGSVEGGIPGFNATAEHLVVPPEVEEAGLHMLLRSLLSLILRYNGTLQEDRATLSISDGTQTAPVSWGHSDRGSLSGLKPQEQYRRVTAEEAGAKVLTPKQRAILLCRISEKEILLQAIMWLKIRLGLVSPPEDTSEGPVLQTHYHPAEASATVGSEGEEEEKGHTHTVGEGEGTHTVSDAGGAAAVEAE